MAVADRRRLERLLADLDGFETPSATLEQYPTPADIAAHLVHLAALSGDIENKTVVDLGCGTGLLTLAAALCSPARVVGLDIDRDALATAQKNEHALGVSAPVAWIHADATDPPVRSTDATVLMNPPFGAQTGNEHADRAFLDVAREIGSVCYSIHNAGSRDFVESFVGDAGGVVTHAFAATFDIDRQFAHHTDTTRSIDTEVFRIEWN